jgi:hypothetical protein
MFTGVPKLGGDLVACSKKCAVAAASKDKNGGDSRRSWDHDAKTADGPTSTSILMDWWTTHHQRAGKCTWFRPALYVCMTAFYYYTFCINAGLMDF